VTALAPVVLYPPERGYLGGKKWRSAARWAENHGWAKAWAGVLAEKAGSPRQQATLFEESA
jgi:hypothetical protein